jgi:hypothetical protein
MINHHIFLQSIKILEKPVYLDRLKTVIQEIISTIDTQQKA